VATLTPNIPDLGRVYARSIVVAPGRPVDFVSRFFAPRVETGVREPAKPGELPRLDGAATRC
jgi:hypothetical protein